MENEPVVRFQDLLKYEKLGVQVEIDYSVIKKFGISIPQPKNLKILKKKEIKI